MNMGVLVNFACSSNLRYISFIYLLKLSVFSALSYIIGTIYRTLYKKVLYVTHAYPSRLPLIYFP